MEQDEFTLTACILVFPALVCAPGLHMRRNAAGLQGQPISNGWVLLPQLSPLRDTGHCKTRDGHTSFGLEG